MQMLIMLLYIVFVLSAIVLIVVVLLQEGKGGGLGEALGGHGQATFGVGASGINKFTGWTAAVFLASALAITYINARSAGGSIVDVPPAGGAVQAPPAGGGAGGAGGGGEEGQ